MSVIGIIFFKFIIHFTIRESFKNINVIYVTLLKPIVKCLFIAYEMLSNLTDYIKFGWRTSLQ